MHQNSGCCPPPNRKKDDCCCKDGILCALDWFYQDFLLQGNCSLTDIKYFPQLPYNYDFINSIYIPNTIYYIPYITQDIVPVYTSLPATEPYKGDITYLNICKIEGFSFRLKSSCNVSIKESDIRLRFSKICYKSPNNCCCNNGVMEFLLKAKDFLLDLATNSTNYVTLSTSTSSYRVTQILAINNDTVWFKDECTLDSCDSGFAGTTYYVISLCEIIGITLNRITP